MNGFVYTLLFNVKWETLPAAAVGREMNIKVTMNRCSGIINRQVVLAQNITELAQAYKSDYLLALLTGERSFLLSSRICEPYSVHSG